MIISSRDIQAYIHPSIIEKRKKELERIKEEEENKNWITIFNPSEVRDCFIMSGYTGANGWILLDEGFKYEIRYWEILHVSNKEQYINLTCEDSEGRPVVSVIDELIFDGYTVKVNMKDRIIKLEVK